MTLTLHRSGLPVDNVNPSVYLKVEGVTLSEVWSIYEKRHILVKAESRFFPDSVTYIQTDKLIYEPGQVGEYPGHASWGWMFVIGKIVLKVCKLMASVSLETGVVGALKL